MFVLVVNFILSLSLQLLDTKSTDRKLTLLHYIVETVDHKFPDVRNFHMDLQYVEKASAGKSSKSDCLDLCLSPPPSSLLSHPTHPN